MCASELVENELSDLLNSDKSTEEKLLTLCRKSSTYVVESKRGKKHNWKVRLSAGLKKKMGNGYLLICISLTQQMIIQVGVIYKNVDLITNN